MYSNIIESKYPISFRKKAATDLSDHLKNRHSVEIIGMKRVGISNFLRFFLYNNEFITKSFSKGENHFFIPVDLNDLIESEIFPFWRLTFKRIVDAVENYDKFDDSLKNKIQTLFLNSIQTGDLFLTVDGIRSALKLISQQEVYPTLFLLRFDRLKKSVTKEFFANLQSLPDATGKKLSIVFTTERKLHDLNPEVFDKASLSVFSHLMYLTPASDEDMEIIYESFLEQYKFNINEKLKQKIIKNAGGHVQYLHLSMIIINELVNENLTEDQMIEKISQDERIVLQSEELYSSLTKIEQEVLDKVSKGKKIEDEEKNIAQYLWNTGLLKDNKNKTEIKISYLSYYFDKNSGRTNGINGSDILTKKEHLLFTLLLENKNNITDRDKIVQIVWPEYSAYGVSDWSIDRLVSRLRKKLKYSDKVYQIQTIRTRGFKLIED